MAIEELKRFFERSRHAPTREQYRGVMVGLAVGNALGIPGEGKSRENLRRRFPDGLREIDPAARQHLWDDDTAQSVILAEALLDDAELDQQDFADHLVRWAKENGRGIGNLTRRVLSKLESGTPVEDAAREVWEEDGREPAGNGAVMRCAPVALRWRRSGHSLVEVTRKSALVTHYDPRCVWSAVAFNGALALSLGGGSPDLEGLARLLDGAGAPAAVGEAVRRLRGCALGDLGLDDRDTMGYTIKAMQVGLWALQQEPDFERVLLEVVNAGGDTDTNGAVAGAVMGARVGAAGIPPQWLNHVRDEDHLTALADRLFDASEGPASDDPGGRSIASGTRSEEERVRIFDIPDLQTRGFQGFMAIRELENNAEAVVTRPGIYVVIRIDDGHPHFLVQNPGGRPRGQDPTVPISRLQEKWVPNAQTLYIGSTERQLRDRIGELVQFSRGQNVGHRGGRYLWQVECSCDFKVAWLEHENPKRKEQELLTEFERCFGRLPFANLRRGKRDP